MSRRRTISPFSMSRYRGEMTKRWGVPSRPIPARFIPDTHLIRYGEGDWNDSLQPSDPRLRDAMVSSWTVALLYQQLVRYADVLRRAGRDGVATELSALALAMRADFNRFLVRDGTVAGYGLFEAGRDAPELLLHPSDLRTGLKY